jgi:ring-1,2-phenylacetyl-CoA epoxidase subunit PaaB
MIFHNPSKKLTLFFDSIPFAQAQWLTMAITPSKNGLEHRHFGSLHAPDADMALKNARDVYTRRNEGVSIWVVESKNIKASNPDDNGEMFEPATDKAYRHPTFYDLPDDIEHM